MGYSSGGYGSDDHVASLVLNLLLKQNQGGGKGGGNWGKKWKDTKPAGARGAAGEIDRSDYDKSGGELGEHMGIIKSIVGKGKFGFIESATLKQAGWEEVFVLGPEL